MLLDLGREMLRTSKVLFIAIKWGNLMLILWWSKKFGKLLCNGMWLMICENVDTGNEFFFRDT